MRNWRQILVKVLRVRFAVVAMVALVGGRLLLDLKK